MELHLRDAPSRSSAHRLRHQEKLRRRSHEERSLHHRLLGELSIIPARAQEVGQHGGRPHQPSPKHGAGAKATKQPVSSPLARTWSNACAIRPCLAPDLYLGKCFHLPFGTLTLRFSRTQRISLLRETQHLEVFAPRGAAASSAHKKRPQQNNKTQRSPLL